MNCVELDRLISIPAGQDAFKMPPPSTGESHPSVEAFYIRDWRQQPVTTTGMAPTVFAFLVPVFIVAIATPLYVYLSDLYLRSGSRSKHSLTKGIYQSCCFVYKKATTETTLRYTYTKTANSATIRSKRETRHGDSNFCSSPRIKNNREREDTRRSTS